MTIKMVIPKGRQNTKVLEILQDVGIHVQGSERNYRPKCSDDQLEIKLLKSQNIPMMVAMGQHDFGFSGKDWIEEQQAEVVTLLDLGFDPVQIVACIPEDWEWSEVSQRKIIAVSEYRRLCRTYLESVGVAHTFLRSFGATEVFPPEDADLIVDNTSTGTTLKANRLKIVDTLLTSTTVMLANPRALDDPKKRDYLENLTLLTRAVLEGRKRVLLEMNCSEEDLDGLVAMLPSMKAPTISKLYRQSGFAVKAAVPRREVKELIPKLLANGASDILETPIYKVVS